MKVKSNKIFIFLIILVFTIAVLFKADILNLDKVQKNRTEKKCVISISCITILDNLEDLDKEKLDLVPQDGWILEPIEVSFNEGESAFDLLLRTCKQNKIHMEFQDTPLYDSKYVKGINNLYEFDCGNLSGWMYSVNDWYPNYGSSKYIIKENDNISWNYTCDLGNDLTDKLITE